MKLHRMVVEHIIGLAATRRMLQPTVVALVKHDNGFVRLVPFSSDDKDLQMSKEWLEDEEGASKLPREVTVADYLRSRGISERATKMIGEHGFTLQRKLFGLVMLRHSCWFCKYCWRAK